jgi:murein DD-endopeptidase MepM/ murein hydrolase activator NlpD
VNDLGRKIKRAAFAFYLIAIHAALAFFAFAYFFPIIFQIQNVPVEDVSNPLTPTPAPTPLPVPSEFVTETPQPQPDQPSPSSDLPADVLMIPVKGVKRANLVDTFTASRSNGRVHDAIDIMAPQGTPVLAAADGEIMKFFNSVAGGTTIYELSADSKYIYYYAHLQRRADDLHEHDQVARGRVIGFVGDTGNAAPGNYHLHFAISIVDDPKRFWSGTPINPYPLLMNGIETP